MASGCCMPPSGGWLLFPSASLLEEWSSTLGIKGLFHFSLNVVSKLRDGIHRDASGSSREQGGLRGLTQKLRLKPDLLQACCKDSPAFH